MPSNSSKEIDPTSSPAKFKKTEYSEGYFETDGTLVMNPFNERQLKDWERFNLICGSKLFGKGQKLFLPTDEKPGFKLIFGRNADTCDVVIDTDIVGNYAQREDAVSRQHFSIQKNQNGEWEITDLGSTNGLMSADVNNPDSEFNYRIPLKPYVLEDGNILLIGGGPGVAGRLIGFVYHEMPGSDPFLTKFNATSASDLAIVRGIYQQNPELLGKISNEDLAGEVKRVVSERGQFLGSSYLKLKSPETSQTNENYYHQSHQYFSLVLTTAKELGDKYYQGNWFMALSEIADWLLGEAETIGLKQNVDSDLSEIRKATKYLELANYLNDLYLEFGFESR